MSIIGVSLWEPEFRLLMDGEYPHGVCYDYYGAAEPEDARLPMSYWNKARIVRYCHDSKRISREACRIAERMNLDDLRSIALRYAGTDITGSRMNIEQTRHTRFYSLDVDGINSMAAGA